ncbi:MAG: sodium-dependent transporter [Halanaerobiales bacterium]|nr:sodium-dependent transporter [Halanaerobiales bacterium]
MQRDRWNNRTAFVLAAIGSAAGLGNAWRFPYMAYSNGGGAFLIPYFVALLTAGIPLIVLEFSMGQKTQRGAPGALAKVSRKFEGFGWWAVLAGTIITSYYAGVMAWAWDYLAGSFTLGWANDAGTYFYEEVLQISSGPGNLGGFSIPVLIGLIVTWIAIYFILKNGAQSVGKVVYITVPLPIILLGILLIRAVTLPGAVEGINYFLQPDFTQLLNPSVWIDAYSQVFFTLSLGFGIMIAYASYMPEDSDIINNALITVFANSGISFMAGIAVFGTLGYMAQTQGVPISEVATAGVGLAFVVYPNAISLLPGGPMVIGLFGFVFFAMLLSLGIDSAFSIVEAGVAAIKDKWGGTKQKVTLYYSLFLFVVGLLFVTKAGLYWLDIVDHYVNTYGLVFAGLTESIIVGWFYKPNELRNYFNSVSEYKFGNWWNVMVKFITPLVLTVLLISNLITDITAPYGDGAYELKYLFYGGWIGVVGVLILLSYLLSRQRGLDDIAS